MGQNHTWAIHHVTSFCYRRRLEAVFTNKSFCTKYEIHFSSSMLFPCDIPFYYTKLNFYLFCFLCMYGLLGFLPTSGDNYLSTAPLEIYLLTKMVACSIFILPAVYGLHSWNFYGAFSYYEQIVLRFHDTIDMLLCHL